MKILHLTLSKQPFEVMVTGEKKFEFREPSNWMASRLTKKTYDVVKFVNGYGADKPYFIAKYVNFWQSNDSFNKQYSNGLSVEIKRGDFIIHIGEILEKGNLITN